MRIMANPTRFFNLPAAMVSILVRKLLDTYTGVYGDITDLVLPNGYGTLQKILREILRFNGIHVYIIGVAATSFICYLKKSKMIRIISRRSRTSNLNRTSSSLLRRPRPKPPSSIRMLFNREEKILSYLKHCSLSASRRSYNIASNSILRQNDGTTISAPPMLQANAERNTINFCGQTSPAIMGSPLISPSSSVICPEDNRFDLDSLRMSTPFPTFHNNRDISLDLQIPNRTHLHDVHGNIYERRSLPMRAEYSGLDTARLSHERFSDKNIQIQPTTPTTIKSFQSGDNCDIDLSRIADDTDMEVYTPSIIREILPSEIDVGDFKIPSVIRDYNLKNKRTNAGRTPKKKPRRTYTPKRRKTTKSRKALLVERIQSEGRTRNRLYGRGLRKSPRPTGKA